jgi:hypothetical protein
MTLSTTNASLRSDRCPRRGAIDEVARRIWQRRDQGRRLAGFEDLAPERLPWASPRDDA